VTTPTVTGYSFKYTTPTPDVDPDGNPITVDVPTEFVVGGIPEKVAQGMLNGMLGVKGIANQTCQAVLQGYSDVEATPEP
jgi:hypothetical protein